jgi:hypothetical protein
MGEYPQSGTALAPVQLTNQCNTSLSNNTLCVIDVWGKSPVHRRRMRRPRPRPCPASRAELHDHGKRRLGVPPQAPEFRDHGEWWGRSEALPRTGSRRPSPAFTATVAADRDKPGGKWLVSVKSGDRESPGRREWPVIIGGLAAVARRAKSEGAAPRPFMILKDFPEGVRKILQDHGSTAGGTTESP